MFRKSNIQSGANGFTITEIMVVTVLLGLASALAIPQFGGNTEQYAKNASTSISQTIQYAQDLAVTTQSPVTLSITESGFVYTLTNSLGDTLTHPVNHKPFEVDLRDNPNMAQLTIETDFGSFDDVVFDAFGTPNTGGTITMSHTDMPSDVVLTLHPATGSVAVTQTD
jgi:prepilin-type N-terminal cleavage/methylation domain-containing protein